MQRGRRHRIEYFCHQLKKWTIILKIHRVEWHIIIKIFDRTLLRLWLVEEMPEHTTRPILHVLIGQEHLMKFRMDIVNRHWLMQAVLSVLTAGYIILGVWEYVRCSV